MKAIILAVILALTTVTAAAGETSISLGAGWNGNLTGSSVPWENGSGVGSYLQIAHEEQVTEHLSFVGHYTHLSQWDIGPPFNDERESTVDHIGFAFKWKF